MQALVLPRSKPSFISIIRMSLLQWVRKNKDKNSRTASVQRSFLPTATNAAVAAANEAAEKELEAADTRKRKRGTYHTHSDEVRAQIGCHAAENGNKSAVDKFSKKSSRRSLDNLSTRAQCRSWLVSLSPFKLSAVMLYISIQYYPSLRQYRRSPSSNIAIEAKPRYNNIKW